MLLKRISFSDSIFTSIAKDYLERYFSSILPSQLCLLFLLCFVIKVKDIKYVCFLSHYLAVSEGRMLSH